MRTVFVILALSWVLNALMDAIDHGKGDKTLYELWHILKFASYAIPFGYICYLNEYRIVWTFYVIVIPALWGIWELTYRAGRFMELRRWDNWVKIPFLRWIWGIKNHED
jgi:hypothetical protein